jgi:hypothetical protein
MAIVFGLSNRNEIMSRFGFMTHPELAVLAPPLSRERGAKTPKGGLG